MFDWQVYKISRYLSILCPWSVCQYVRLSVPRRRCLGLCLATAGHQRCADCGPSADGRRSAAIFATVQMPSSGAYRLAAPGDILFSGRRDKVFADKYFRICSFKALALITEKLVKPDLSFYVLQTHSEMHVVMVTECETTFCSYNFLNDTVTGYIIGKSLTLHPRAGSIV